MARGRDALFRPAEYAALLIPLAPLAVPWASPSLSNELAEQAFRPGTLHRRAPFAVAPHSGE
jgi:hypothetical protein